MEPELPAGDEAGAPEKDAPSPVRTSRAQKLAASLIGQNVGWYAHGDRAGFLASVGGAIVVLIAYEALMARGARAVDSASKPPTGSPPR